MSLIIPATSLWYFAHPVSDYGTAAETKILNGLVSLGLSIENPNQPHHQEGYARKSMDYYVEDVLPGCVGCVFLAFPGGMVGSGVAMEVEYFLERGYNAYEIFLDPGIGTVLFSCPMIPDSRILTREETRGATKVFRSLPNGGRSL
jgi:hypothetical protein